MNFINSLKKFNINYNDIKYNIIKAIKKYFIISGSGGSNNIIISEYNYIIKIIPIILNPLLKNNNNNDYLESNIYIKLTDEFIKTNITPHIVSIYKKYYIDDINIIFPDKCLTLDEKLMKKNIYHLYDNNICYLKKLNNNNLLDKKKIHILILEKCSYNINICIYNLFNSKLPIKQKLNNFKKILYRIIFQLLFTLTVIKKKYPNFIHNDLFLRNILAINYTKYNNNDYIEYNLLKKKYYLPANGIFIKLNDFGYSLNILNKNSTLEKEIIYSVNNQFELYNNYRDVYTFFFDLYDGQNIGSLSLKSLIYKYIKNKIKQKQYINVLHKTLINFFNYKIINKIKNKQKNILDDLWNISESSILMNTVKQPKEYFNNDTFKFYTIKPKYCNIIKTYN